MIVEGLKDPRYIPDNRITSNVPGSNAVSEVRPGGQGWTVLVPTDKDAAAPSVLVRVAPTGDFATVSVNSDYIIIHIPWAQRGVIIG